MAGELQVPHDTTARTIYAHLWNAVGQIYYSVTPAFEAYSTSHLSSYSIACVEQGTASRFYMGTMPAVAAGRYRVVYKDRAGGSPAESDTTILTEIIEWSGTAILPRTGVAGVVWNAVTASYGNAGSFGAGVPAKLTSDGLDDVDVAAPTEVAATFPKMMVQLWRRAFGKTTRDEAGIRTYADDGETVITTQTYTSTPGTETVGPAV